MQGLKVKYWMEKNKIGYQVFQKLQIEKHEDSIQKYITARHKVDDEVQKILNDVLIKNELDPCRICNIGSVIAKSILKNDNADIYARRCGKIKKSRK